MPLLRGMLSWVRRPIVRAGFWSTIFVTALVAGVVARERIMRLVDRWDSAQPVRDRSAGTLFIVGGGPLSPSLKREFLELAGGENARLVIIPGAAISEQRRHEYLEDWKHLGVQSVHVLHAESRREADDPEFSSVLDQATGVWLGGGLQTWFSAWYRQTKVEDRLHGVLARGGVIGGTSAGASAMSAVMMAGGRGEPIEGRGLGLFPEAVIDQHCLRRNRVARMMKMLDGHPDLIGLGIDESTAVIVERSRMRLTVSGASYVVAYVPRTTNGESRLEILNPGDQVTLADLRTPEGAIMPGWIADSFYE